MQNMKRNYVYFLFTCLLTFVVSGCDTDIEPEVIQAANTYNEEYYQVLCKKAKNLQQYISKYNIVTTIRNIGIT